MKAWKKAKMTTMHRRQAKTWPNPVFGLGSRGALASGAHHPATAHPGGA